MMIEQVKYYVVARHGTAGLDSYGYAEVTTYPMKADQTTTVRGPYLALADAEMARNELEAPLREYRALHEGE